METTKLGSTQKSILFVLVTAPAPLSLKDAMPQTNVGEVTRRSQAALKSLVDGGLAERVPGPTAVYLATEAGRSFAASLVHKSQARVRINPISEAEIEAARLKAIAAMPAKLECRGPCKQMQTREEIGVRVIRPKKAGGRIYIYRQSHCERCRAHTGKTARAVDAAPTIEPTPAPTQE